MWDQASENRAMAAARAGRFQANHWTRETEPHRRAIGEIRARSPPQHMADVHHVHDDLHSAQAAKRLRFDGQGVHHPRATALNRRGVHSQKVFY